LSYFWQKSARLQYLVAPVNINLVNTPFISESFRNQLELYRSQGVPLIESFRTGIVSSINATRLYNSNNINQTRDAAYLKLFVEVGNVPRVIGSIFGKKDVPGTGNFLAENLPRSTSESYRSYSFAKFNIDARRYFKLSENTYFVVRGNTGIAAPIAGADDNILPYDRFYFAGGGSSVRAWRPRKLGPGSFQPPIRLQNGNELNYDGYVQRDYSSEQPGEILIESNYELRFNIFSYLNGALFVDAGNVWTLQEDQQRPGSEFSKDFLSEIAVGAGFGFRFDFSFLVLRLDIATKVYDPAEEKGERYVLNRFRLNKNTFKSTNVQNSFNLGIGYPF